MVAREGERAVDFLREVLSHDLVAARKVENVRLESERRPECRSGVFRWSKDRNKDGSPTQTLNSFKPQYVTID